MTDVRCGVRLSARENVGNPDFYWLAGSSGVACTNGTASDSFVSAFDRVRLQLATERILRP